MKDNDMTLRIRLRLANTADAPALTTLMHRSKGSWGYSDAQMALIREHDAVTPEQIATQHVLVADLDGRPVAYLAVEKEDDRSLLVDHLFVAPEVQGQGIGKLLLARAEDQARQLGLSRLCLKSDVHAGSFYERHGFTTCGTLASKLVPGKHAPLMERYLPPAIHRVGRIDLVRGSGPWAFEHVNRAAIADHFAEAQKRTPELWNGRTLKLVDYVFEDGVFRGTCVETSFAAFLAWRDWGAPDMACRNLFGSAVLRSGDGALLYGVMGPGTANTGLIYPPGGGLDLDDVTSGGTIDIQGSLLRELAEETGIQAGDVTPGPTFIVFDGPRISCARVLDVPVEAGPLRERIMRFSAASEDQELSDVRIMRHPQDLEDPMIVPFARVLGKALLDGRQPATGC